MPLNPSAYYAEPLAQAQMRGAQLGQLRGNEEMRRAKMDAEMQAYGVGSMPELMSMKATETREAAENQARNKRLKDAGDILDDWEEMEPAMRAAYQKNEDFRGAVSHLVDPDSLSLEKDGMRYVAATAIPSKIKGYDGKMRDGETVVGQEYIKVETPEGPYMKEVVGTQKLKGKAAKAEKGTLQWDKAARDTVMKLVGTTTASGIVIDPERQQETQIALSLLNKYQSKDVNTAATEALAEARSIVQKVDPNKQVARTGKDKKTGKTVVEYTDGTREYME